MRIALASDDGKTIAGHTGRCRGFVIYEVIGGQPTRREYRENRFTAHARGECDGTHEDGSARGVGHHAHGALLDALGDCCAVVSRGMGPRLVADLTRAGIDAYVCDESDVGAAVEAFAAGRLRRIEGRTCQR